MPISSETRTAGPFLGDGTEIDCPFSFKVFEQSDVVVVETNAEGVVTNLVLNTDYTVALNADQDDSPGGTVTVTATDGSTVNITSSVSLTQGVSLTNGGGFFPDVITNALDRVTVLVQQLARDFGASISIPFGANYFQAGGSRIANVGAPTADNDAVTKSYVDAMSILAGNMPVPDGGDKGAILKTLNDGTVDWWGGSETVSSAATVDLTDSKPYVRISGTTAITSLGSPLMGGEVRIVNFLNTLTLTHGSTLLLPTGANISTAADDVAIFVSRGGASGWRCISYLRASGVPLALSSNQVTSSHIADGSITSGKIADSVIGYAKMAAAAIATITDILSGAAAKLVTADILKPMLDVCELKRSTSQSINASTSGNLSFDIETQDTGSWHDNVTNNSRVTANFAGTMEVIASAYGTGSNGYMQLNILKNGVDTGFVSTGAVGTSNVIAATVSGIISVSAGDYIEVLLTNRCAAAISFYPVLSARRVR